MKDVYLVFVLDKVKVGVVGSIFSKKGHSSFLRLRKRVAP
jgi:hypothetical protein